MLPEPTTGDSKTPATLVLEPLRLRAPGLDARPSAYTPITYIAWSLWLIATGLFEPLIARSTQRNLDPGLCASEAGSGNRHCLLTNVGPPGSPYRDPRECSNPMKQACQLTLCSLPVWTTSGSAGGDRCCSADTAAKMSEHNRVRIVAVAAALSEPAATDLGNQL
jgi:hypothetical protein